MEFKKNDEVKIISLKKSGRILEIKNNNAIVLVGSVKAKVLLSDLKKADDSTLQKQKFNYPNKERVKLHAQKNNSLNKERTIDLHGFTMEQASEAVKSAINEGFLAGINKINFIHGHGTGRVKSCVHTTLDSLEITSYRIDDVNSGVTVVYLK